MARTIGRKNIRLVEELTQKYLEKERNTIFEVINITESVLHALPQEVFETWEGARTEIDRIIWDTRFKDVGR